jgi:uncharacterized membrane protein
MANFFSSLHKTLMAGLVLLVVILALYGLNSGQWVRADYAWFAFVMKWLHVLGGIMWIGVLYYFNFVQAPTMPKIEPSDHRAAITKFILPEALFWFRWAAAFTVLTGLLVAWMNGYLMNALLLHKGYVAIGIGMWLALIMAFNVWFVIWPNQKKVIGLVEASAEEKAAAGRMAGMTSRINTMLSIPMLYFMIAQQNAGL